MPHQTQSAAHRAVSALADGARLVAGSQVVPRSERRFSADTANLIAMGGDLAMVIAGLMLGFWLRFESGLIPRTNTWWTTGDNSVITFRDYSGLMAIGAFILFASFLNQHLYRLQNLLRFRRVVRIVVQSSIVWLMAYLGLSLALKFSPPISRIYVILSFLCTLTTVLTWRYFFHRLLRFAPISAALRQRLIFVGWNPEAARLAEVIHADIAQPYEIVGCVPSPNGRYLMAPTRNLKTLGDYQQLPDLLRTQAVDMVVLADLDTRTGEIVGLTNLCERLMIQFKVIPSYFQIMVSGLALETISGVPILGVEELPLDRMHNRLLKRIVDIVGALVGLIGSAPLMLWFGFRIKSEDGGPIFFKQERVGRLGRTFPMYKLRSMKMGAEKSDHLNQSTLREDPRLLKVGTFIRRWNIDEVPQFWNVLKGDMSLVGPRPERLFHSEKLADEIPHYNARYASKPGITGWAQVNGLRGEGDLTERVRYDLFYLENWSLWLDFQILTMTLISRKNAY
ncbi:MAG: exopolysaccharide biosynthesis polyprenyl glycosylphosphotransferase [Verrucomicrobia bacterium]|nr:exopolysaccharide biosynthesis polyprenyl glycosylphosphotransferase [Verrucomicrobiota bacterium]